MLMDGTLTEEQLAIRRKGVCGSDIAAICGLSPFKTALTVFLDKVDLAAPFVITKPMKRGIFLEPGLRRWYADETHAEVAEVGTVVHRKKKLVIATPDGVARLPGEKKARALELKSPGRYTEGWGRPGTDEVPIHYLLQGAWQMMATELYACDFGALLDDELKIYTVWRDRELEEGLLDHGQRFWTDYVRKNRPPPVKGLDDPYLRARFPKDNGATLHFSALAEDVQAVVLQYLERWKAEKEAAKEREDLAAAIKATMGPASHLQGEGFRIDWTLAQGRTSTDYEAAFRESLKDNPGLLEELEQKHTRIGKAQRRFTPYLLKGSAK